MVGSIDSPYGRPRLLVGNDTSAAGSAAGRARAGTPNAITASGDSVSLSATARAHPEGLAGPAPVDSALVARIGAAIAEGNYPIDPDGIVEALFRDHIDLNGLNGTEWK